MKIDLGEIKADFERKNIRKINLRVYPPNGRVRIAAPQRVSLDTIRMFAISKLGWIKKQQAKFLNREKEFPKEYRIGESHCFFGKSYILQVTESNSKPSVTISHDTLVLQVKPNSGIAQRQAVLQEWYREQLKIIVPKYIEQWEVKMRVKVNEFGIKKMKTRWGTCNKNAGRIWINLELARKPLECLEYIIVHEMVHLLEIRHNNRFAAYMDKFMPTWRHVRQNLNRMPSLKGNVKRRDSIKYPSDYRAAESLKSS